MRGLTLHAEHILPTPSERPNFAETTTAIVHGRNIGRSRGGVTTRFMIRRLPGKGQQVIEVSPATGPRRGPACPAA